MSAGEPVYCKIVPRGEGNYSAMYVFTGFNYGIGINERELGFLGIVWSRIPEKKS